MGVVNIRLAISKERNGKLKDKVEEIAQKRRQR